MPILTTNTLAQTYKNEYSAWNEKKKIQEAKRQEYLRQNPDAIKDYDLQRAKILLYAVDMMDKSVSLNSDHINTLVESITSVALGYAAIAGAGMGLLFQRIGFVKNLVNKMSGQFSKSKNIISMAITTVSGVLGVAVAYPAYAFLSNIESKIDRKKRFDTMEKELQDPKIFMALDDEQKVNFDKAISEIEKTNKPTGPKINIEKSWKSLKKASHEIMNYDESQANFRKKYEEDKSYYEKTLTEKEIKDAKKDKVLLCVLIKEINAKSQSYTEKMQKITDNLITISFALGSIFTLGYERLAQNLKLKKSSLPAGMGIFLMLTSTIFATWAQSRASHIGRFKAKQELMQNPERLVYISNRRTNTIDESKIQIDENQKTTTWQFMKDFFKHNKEYEEWKKAPSLSGKDISKAMESVEYSQEQLQDGKRLKTNMFKAFYKVDSNTQNYSSKIDLIRESVKYPIMLVLGTIGSVLGVKHLVKLRSAISPNEIFKESAKYVGTITLFSIPAMFLNSYFAKIKKMGARISDMLTMQDLEDYRFFADYSKYKNNQE